MMRNESLALGRLGRRERQLVETLFEIGEPASVAEVLERLPDPPSYSSVRAMLSKLEEKGFVRHGEKNLKYVYEPTTPRRSASKSAIARVVEVFFGGSRASAAEALLDESDQLSDQDLEALERKITEARRARRSELE